MTTQDSAVHLDGISKAYGGTTVVDDLTLHLRPGEFFSLLGPSGCGKTTTLRMIAGFAEPDSGTVTLGGVDVTGLPPNKRNVNTVFQSYATFEHLSVRDNVAFGLKRRGVDKREIRTRVDAMLEMVELGALADRRPSTLSGGQRQRVAVARALVNRPAVLLLDEPLAALDLKLRRQMQVELKQIQREVGITFVFVTHDQEEALTMSDRLAVLHEGRIAQVGTPEDVYEHPASGFVAGFIGTSNLMTGEYQDGTFCLPGGVPIPVVPRDDLAGRGSVFASVRPEKIWLADFEPGMVRVRGTLRETVYSGATTTYLVEIAPGVQISALEQNVDRSRREERWTEGETVDLGWKREHCRLLAAT